MIHNRLSADDVETAQMLTLQDKDYLSDLRRAHHNLVAVAAAMERRGKPRAALIGAVHNARCAVAEAIRELDAASG